jgi:kinesin family protein 18/19
MLFGPLVLIFLHHGAVSYLEIYNETIRDLLTDGPSPVLNLREGNNRVAVPGLSEHAPHSAEEVIQMIHRGNSNRQVSPTEANAVSSRSHAVLSVNVKRRARTADISEDYSLATLSVIDLAGSERASVTKNKGERLLEGANINRSLLALGNCINALCDPRKRGHVPYRDSKLTRLLKHSLGGNCKTVMIVCVSPSSQHYDETHNTLQYANRAKEIKTKVTRNVVSVDRHVSQYVRVIFELRQELEARKKDDGEREQRAREDERREMGKAYRDAGDAASRVRTSFDELCAKAVRAAKAKAELESLESASAIFRAWRSRFFDDAALRCGSAAAVDALSKARQSVDALTASLSSHGRGLSTEAAVADNSRSMYDAIVAGFQRKLKHREAARQFDREMRMVQLELDVAVARASEQGRLEGVKAQARVMAAMAELRSRFAVPLSGEETERAELARLADCADAANREAFLALAAGSTSSSAILNSNDLDVDTAARLSTGNKRPAPPRSPGHSMPAKSRRSSVLGPGSTAASTSSASSSSSRRSSYARSPGKATAKFRATGSIKSAFSSPRRRALEKSKKSVAWRDETGDGWELEEVQGGNSVEMDAADDSFSTATNASPNPNPNPWTSPPTTAGPSSENISTPAPDLLSAQMRASRDRMSTGFLGRKKEPTASRATTLESLGEEVVGDVQSSDQPFTFLRADPYPYGRAPLGEMSNNGPATAGSSSSATLAAPIVASTAASTPRKAAAASSRAARRNSSIGPMRSAKKARHHRLSYIPQPSPNESFTGNTAPGRSFLSSAAGAPTPHSGERRSPRKMVGGGRDHLVPGSALKPLPRARREARLSGSSSASASRTSPRFSLEPPSMSFKPPTWK